MEKKIGTKPDLLNYLYIWGFKRLKITMIKFQ